MADKFVDVEDTEQMILETAHAEVIRLARLQCSRTSDTSEEEGLTFDEVRTLRLLYQIVRDSTVLEMSKFELKKRLSIPATEAEPARLTSVTAVTVNNNGGEKH